MTKEEAREILTHNWTRVDNPNYSESELDEAFFMAIEALSAEPSDLISRADAIEAVYDGCVWYKTALCEEGKEEWECSEVNKIRHLPSAEAVQGCSGDEEPGQWQTENGKPSKAEYSVYCSKCGSWSEYRTKYCGNCGSLMKEENNDK